MPTTTRLLDDGIPVYCPLKRGRFSLFACIQLCTLLLSIVKPVGGLTVSNHLKKFELALATQDKICSMDHVESKRSYGELIGTLTGISFGAMGQSSKIYTGFKFHRIYHFGKMLSKPKPSLQLSFCEHGKVKWQTEIKYHSDIDWDLPFCVYSQNNEATSDQNPSRAWGVLKKSNRNQNIVNRPSLKELARQDTTNFHCFKMARREKYTRHSRSIYLPNEWIGGLFYCELTPGAKSQLVDQMGEDLQIEPTNSRTVCNRDNAIPLQPLISDSYRKHWTNLKPGTRIPFLRRITRTNMDKVIPFLHTPNSDSVSRNYSTKADAAVSESNRKLRGKWFSSVNWLFGSKAEDHLWYNEVEVEESYGAMKTQCNLTNTSHVNVPKISKAEALGEHMPKDSKPLNSTKQEQKSYASE
ncbi:LAQU0S08e03422g1_1 [Lachancea quebecensis]|uniref:LAQU0S08e03422g1_1 n=1 Tax=Lachancea quebecensis TaxID=1654605 RepID=A0A0P1KVA4_9SACH|nr:LAQU0S08e03422g1_1 [Lachancea quebecensis]